MNEVWKEIAGYEGLYEVSNLGRVKSLNHPQLFILSPVLTVFGYHEVSLRKNGSAKIFKLHRLVATTFLENPLNKRCINHKSGVKINNAVDNIEWCTYSENTKHMYRVLNVQPGSTWDNTEYPLKARSVSSIDNNGNIETYKSLTNAATYHNIHRAAICTAIKKGHRAAGFHWKYAE